MALDEHKVVGVLSTDMSRAFGSLYHPLTLAKFKAHGVHENIFKKEHSELSTVTSLRAMINY